MITPMKFLLCPGLFRPTYTGNLAIHTHRDSNHSAILSIRFCGRQGNIGARMLWFQWHICDGTIAAIFGGGLCDTKSADITWDFEPPIISSIYMQVLLGVCVLCMQKRFCKKDSSSSLELGSFVRLRKHISLERRAEDDREQQAARSCWPSSCTPVPHAITFESSQTMYEATCKS